ncbi:MAG TPA: hypothetical protein VHG90_01495 [Acidimicrobiales bacterium]|nr:hypothetical protein [Acidimicrobiales bacterium]
MLDRFTQRPCYTKTRTWPAWRVVSTCTVEKHPAPAEGCTCGVRGVEDVSALHTSDDDAILAKVDLWGRRLGDPGSSDEYGPARLRAAGATLLEIHLPPSFQGGRARMLADRYPEVAVYGYGEEDWPASVPIAGQRVHPSPEALFLADVRRVGFGWVDTSDPAAAQVVLKLGDSSARYGARAFRPTTC